MYELMGKTALITGAGRGIGRVTALKLASLGAKVAVNDLPIRTETQSVVDEINSHGGEAIMVLADVSHSKEVRSMVSQVEQQWGKIDILVNNHAVVRDNMVLHISDDDWDFVMDVNLKGTFYCTKYALRGMLAQSWGRIINIASMAGVVGNAWRSNYCASKGGIIAFTKSVAREVGSRNITVNAIAPGLIMTHIAQTSISEKEKGEVLSRLALRRFGKPEDVAGAVAFLASDEAAYITAQVISVDGGL